MSIKTVAKTNWFPVFRAGTHTDSAGVTRQWSEHDIDKIVELNSSRLQDVPAVVGHPQTNDPAYGWLGGLKKVMVDGTAHLFACLSDAVAEFVDAVDAGMYKHVSLSLDPDLATLRHIGFLGAAAPAVEGLGPVRFSADCGEGVIVEFAAPDKQWRLKSVLRTFANAFQRVREFLVDKYDVDTANNVIGPDAMGWVAEDIGKIETAGAAFAAPASHSATGDPMDEQLKQENEALKAKVAEFSEKADRAVALEEENAQLKASADAAARAQRRAEFSTFVESLVKGGRLLPAQFDVAVGLLEHVHAAEPVQFSAEATATPLDALMGLLKSYPEQSQFSRVADKRTAGGAPDNADAMDIAQRATEYQAQQRQKGIAVSIAQAVTHVTRQ